MADEKVNPASGADADDDKALKRDLPACVMLGAGVVTCIACLILQVRFVTTLEFVLLTLVVFFIVGKVISAVIRRMDFENAKLREAQAEQDKKDKAEALRQELAEAEAQDEADGDGSVGVPDPRVTVGRSVSGKV